LIKSLPKPKKQFRGFRVLCALKSPCFIHEPHQVDPALK
jgi:hypothetical protein